MTTTVTNKYMSFRLRKHIFIYFLHLYSCKIEKDNKDLLKIKMILTQEGGKVAKEEGDSRTNQKSLDCTCK